MPRSACSWSVGAVAKKGIYAYTEQLLAEAVYLTHDSPLTGPEPLAPTRCRVGAGARPRDISAGRRGPKIRSMRRSERRELARRDARAENAYTKVPSAKVPSAGHSGGSLSEDRTVERQVISAYRPKVAVKTCVGRASC